MLPVCAPVFFSHFGCLFGTISVRPAPFLVAALVDNRGFTAGIAALRC